MQTVTTIAKGLTGLAALEITDKTTELLAETAITAAGVAADTATFTAVQVASDISNPVGIIDAILKLVVSIVTVWQLIKKPKPKTN